MNNENKDGHLTTGEGFGILCMLTAAFSILKLNGVIGWSWLWVLAPLWIPAVIAVGILLICLVVVLCCELLKGAHK